MAILKLSAPWHTYYKELNELFKFDDEVRIVYDTDEQIINIYVEDAAKAEAMAAVLPTEKDFGGIKVLIVIIPANSTFKKAKSVRGSLYEDLFRGNPIVDDIVTIEGVMTMIVFLMLMVCVLLYIRILQAEYLMQVKVFSSVLIQVQS